MSGMSPFHPLLTTLNGVTRAWKDVVEAMKLSLQADSADSQRLLPPLRDETGWFHAPWVGRIVAQTQSNDSEQRLARLFRRWSSELVWLERLEPGSADSQEVRSRSFQRNTR